jgi:hypothetical protein
MPECSRNVAQLSLALQDSLTKGENPGKGARFGPHFNLLLVTPSEKEIPAPVEDGVFFGGPVSAFFAA